ncbi:unnamed protein product [marine sediment metagenome]|uniref:Uncharacterized protein n=1 Tax=marine sediment metagenome TaxID=412755 RepID=X1RQY6_9ZZZZ
MAGNIGFDANVCSGVVVSVGQVENGKIIHYKASRAPSIELLNYSRWMIKGLK